MTAERTALDRRLDLQRAEVAGVLAGLTDDEARTRLVPSLTTPLGLVKHATFVEQVWFHARLAGVGREALGIPDTVDESFALLPDDTVASVLTSYAAVCAGSREIAAAHDLDEELAWHERRISLRETYGHLVAELARHAGHGDILVELLRAAREDQVGDSSAG